MLGLPGSTNPFTQHKRAHVLRRPARRRKFYHRISRRLGKRQLAPGGTHLDIPAYPALRSADTHRPARRARPEPRPEAYTRRGAAVGKLQRGGALSSALTRSARTYDRRLSHLSHAIECGVSLARSPVELGPLSRSATKPHFRSGMITNFRGETLASGQRSRTSKQCLRI